MTNTPKLSDKLIKTLQQDLILILDYYMELLEVQGK